MKAAPAGVPSLADVDAIVAIPDRVLRNLRITECYYRLSQAMTARTGMCANWCTFATWASRQAGRTIRGEDLLERLTVRLADGVALRHPIQSLWRVLLRQGVFRPESRLGRLVRAIHSPFDAFELASEAVAAGNLKVFAEIGREFARFSHISDFGAFLSALRPGGPPEGQQLLRQAFTRYHQSPSNPEAVFLANLEIGLHEQTRLQPEIQAGMEAGATWKHSFFTTPYARFSRALTRAVVTEYMMTLALPDVSLALGRHLDRTPCEALRTLTDPELEALLAKYEPAPPAPDDCGAQDWSALPQRMHFIIHLFRAFHQEEGLLGPPFTPEQVAEMYAGRIPGGVI